jgi:hypothetical protein
MRATEKTLAMLLDEVNKLRAQGGYCPLYFLKEVRQLKLQKRYLYQLYVFPNYGDSNQIKALKSTTSTNELRLYLAGILDGAKIGTTIASHKKEVQNPGRV